jgi:hypothetical protein
VGVRNLQSRRHKHRLDRLLNRLLRVESDDLVRLVGISCKSPCRAKVRARSTEEPTDLF